MGSQAEDGGEGVSDGAQPHAQEVRRLLGRTWSAPPACANHDQVLLDAAMSTTSTAINDITLSVVWVSAESPAPPIKPMGWQHDQKRILKERNAHRIRYSSTAEEREPDGEARNDCLNALTMPAQVHADIGGHASSPRSAYRFAKRPCRGLSPGSRRHRATRWIW